MSDVELALVLRLSRTNEHTRQLSYNLFCGDDLLAAFEGDSPVGFVAFKHYKRKPISKISHIAVHPDKRRRGIFTQLIERVQFDSPHRAIELDCDQSNTGALAAYEALGFVPIGSGTWKNGRKFYTLRKTW